MANQFAPNSQSTAHTASTMPETNGAGAAVSPSKRDLKRWRNHLADELAEGVVYRELAARRTGEEREILLGLAAAEERHAEHWRTLLGDNIGKPLKGSKRTRLLSILAKRFGGVFILALAQQAEGRTEYDTEPAAPAQMLADERIHGEVVRGLATRGRRRMSGTFRAAVFGANDGLVSNLALILGVGASGVSHGTVLLSGIAGLLAGALSMAAGEFVSVSSQSELLSAENPDPQANKAIGDLDVDENELALVYRARGMDADTATAHAQKVMENFSSSTRIADDIETDSHEAIGTPWGAAISSFLFFASGALIPIFPYMFGASGLVAVAWSAGLVGIALLLTGASVGVLSGSSPVKRALRQLAIGLGAAAVTYVLGLLFGTTIS